MDFIDNYLKLATRVYYKLGKKIYENLEEIIQEEKAEKDENS